MLEEEKITNLKREIIEYATLVEDMIDKSIKGLLNKDKGLLIELIEKDEPDANSFEMKLDEMCTVLIAQYQPKAKSLRTILMILKINNNLERMADHAVNIGESSLFLIERPMINLMSDIPKMAEITKSMLKDSIDSFVSENIRLAKDVCERDDTVDELRDHITRELIKIMGSDSKNIEPAIRLLTIARNLERIADLSTNFGEDVIFMVEGNVIKHQFRSPQRRR
jgi:phosphate transport system protein